MSVEGDAAKPASAGEALGGCGVLVLLAMMASCVFGGGDAETKASAPVASISTPAPIASETLVPKGESTSPMTEAERLTLVEIDPEMKQASDFLGLLINSNGHLCAKVSNVELVSGTQYEVTCVEYRNGSGRVRYLVDGATNEATPL